MAIYILRDWDNSDLNSYPFWVKVNEQIYFRNRPDGPPLGNYLIETVMAALKFGGMDMYREARKIVTPETIIQALAEKRIDIFSDTEKSIDILAEHGCRQFLISDGVADFGAIYQKHFAHIFEKYEAVLFEAGKPKDRKTRKTLPELTPDDRIYVVGDSEHSDKGLANNIEAIYVQVDATSNSRLRAAQHIIRESFTN